MALPTIPSYWSSRYKNVQERAMVQRRTHEADFRDQWTDRAKYFNRSQVETVQQNAWTSDQSFRDSMDAMKRRNEKELKALSLKRRRSQLKILLNKERDLYEAELKGRSKSTYTIVQEMKERSDDIKTSRESQRQKIVDEKLYEHWKTNNPDLRKLESEHHKKHVVKGWREQREEQVQKERMVEEERRHYEEEMETQRQAALEDEHQDQESRLVEDKEIAGALKKQMRELQIREAEAKKLKDHQGELQRQEWELAQLEEERKESEKRRKKAETNSMLTRQYKVQLQRKAQEVQKALEMDRRILASLAAKEEEEGQLKSARKEKAKADAVWMKQVIDEQIRLEKAREAELDMLYRDEAARQWQKREAEWERERIARERLMAEVLQDRQSQIRGKMEENRQRQAESLKRREELLREMEIAQQLTQRDKAEEESRKRETKRELGGQMTERRIQRDMERIQLEDDYQREKDAEEVYDEMLCQEASQMDGGEYEPKSYGRHSSRRTAWD